MEEVKQMNQEQNVQVCSYIRRDGTHCPEDRFDNSVFCFWHDPQIDKSGKDVKEKLEGKVKRDANCEGYKLEKAELHEVWLTETNFNDAVFRRANLTRSHMFGISLCGADLFKTHLSSANLRHANLTRANLIGTILEGAKLANIEWGHKGIVLQEIEADQAHKSGDHQTAKTHYKDAEEVYIALKTHFDGIGQSKMVGLFFYREMIVHRKQLPLFSSPRFFSKLADISCGYGEKVLNILLFSLGVIFFYAFVFGFLGTNSSSGIIKFSLSKGIWGNYETYINVLYMSSITYTTCGYGDITPVTLTGKMCAGSEAFIGAFLMALFVIAVYKTLMDR
jgi:hypothetical protein